MSKPPGPHRVAIVGTGGIAAAHVTALKTLGDQVRVVAAVDVDADAASAFSRKWQVDTIAESLDELLVVDPPDVVHVCTPPQSHVKLAAQCLEAGVVPVIEKPPTVSLAELGWLRSLEQDASVRAACVFQHRFGSGAVRLRDMVSEQVLGRPLLGAAHTYWYRDDAYFQVPWRGTWRSEGGGPTMGHGIHQFDLLLSILGPWTEVTAVACNQARATETEDVSLALVRFANGAAATVVNSVVSPRESSYLRVDFEHASVEVTHLYGYTDRDWVFTPAPGAEHLTEHWDRDRVDVPSGHEAQFRAIYQALRTGQTPPVTLGEAYDTVEFIAALYASAFTNQPVRRGDLDNASPFTQIMGGGQPMPGRAA